MGSRDGWPNEMRDRRAADECEELAPFYSIGLHSLPPARNLWQHSALARIKSGVLRCEILARPISAWGSLSTEAAAPAARPTSASPQKLTSVPNEKFGRDGPQRDSCAATKNIPFDHFVGARDERWGHLEAERLSGL